MSPLRRLATSIVVTAATLVALPAAAVTITVAPDGSGDHPTIQAAIDAATDGDVIELLDGTFTGAGNRDLDPGGRAITIRSQSSDAAACVIDAEGAGRGFVFQSGEGPTTRVEHVTVRGGADESADPRGGAIFCGPGASPAFVGCEIRDSFAWAPVPDFGRGGGVFCDEGSAATFEGCSIVGCWSIRGGGVHAAPGSAVRLSDCVLGENEARGAFAGGRGGAAYLAGTSRIESSAVEANAVFSGSHGPGLGGGLFLADLAEAAACEIRGNTSTPSTCCPTWGGGVFVGEAAGASVDGCLLAGNLAGAGAGLGAWGSATITACTIADNGNGTHAAGVIVGADGAHLSLSRTIVWGHCGPELAGSDGSIAVSCSAVGPTGAEGDVDLPTDLVEADPRFCDPGDCASAPFTSGAYGLQSGSPCTAAESPCGAQIGYAGVACGSTPIETTSWGGLKSRYR